MNARSATVAVLAAACLLLTACGGQRIKGRVIEGGIGRAMVVGTADARLTPSITEEDGTVSGQTGFEGVRVRLLRPSSRVTGGPADEIATTTTGPDGFFEIPVRNKAQISGRLEVEASGGGVFQVRNAVFVPRSDQRVLVLVRPNPTAE